MPGECPRRLLQGPARAPAISHDGGRDKHSVPEKREGPGPTCPASSPLARALAAPHTVETLKGPLSGLVYFGDAPCPRLGCVEMTQGLLDPTLTPSEPRSLRLQSHSCLPASTIAKSRPIFSGRHARRGARCPDWREIRRNHGLPQSDDLAIRTYDSERRRQPRRKQAHLQRENHTFANE